MIRKYSLYLLLSLFVMSTLWGAKVKMEKPIVKTEEAKAAEQAAKNEKRWQTLTEKTLRGDKKAALNKLQWYAMNLHDSMVLDKNMFVFQLKPQYDAKKKEVVLNGMVEHPYHKVIAKNIFTRMGFKVNDQIEQLPAKDLGTQLYAVQLSSTAYVYDAPDVKAEQMTQGLYGDYYFLLKKVDGFYYVHSDEGYLGYIEAKHLQTMEANPFAKYLNQKKALLTQDLNIAGLSLSSGTLLRLEGQKEGYFQVKMLDDQVITIPQKDIFAGHFDAEKEFKDITAFMKQYLNVPYDWGGKCHEGLDCSGFTQTAYRRLGVNLARDAYQQFYTGKVIATPWFKEALSEGDLIFFVHSIRGKISHIALSLGEQRFLHAQEPVVTINSLNKKDEDYAADRDEAYIFGRRIHAF